jgi:hypothetical protein
MYCSKKTRISNMNSQETINNVISDRINSIVSKNLEEKKLHKQRNEVINILFNMSLKPYEPYL